MSLNLGRRIICPYSKYEELSKRYPKRTLIAEAYCEDDRAYYCNGRGKLRTVTLRQIDRADYFIWESIPDPSWDGTEYEGMIPSGFMRRIWPRKRASA